MLLHHLRRPGLQNRSGIIANAAAALGHNGGIRRIDVLAVDINRLPLRRNDMEALIRIRYRLFALPTP